MAITRIKPLGWTVKEILTADQINGIDTNSELIGDWIIRSGPKNVIAGTDNVHTATAIDTDAPVRVPHYLSLSLIPGDVVSGTITANIGSNVSGGVRLRSIIENGSATTLFSTLLASSDLSVVTLPFYFVASDPGDYDIGLEFQNEASSGITIVLGQFAINAVLWGAT